MFLDADVLSVYWLSGLQKLLMSLFFIQHTQCLLFLWTIVKNQSEPCINWYFYVPDIWSKDVNKWTGLLFSRYQMYYLDCKLNNEYMD